MEGERGIERGERERREGGGKGGREGGKRGGERQILPKCSNSTHRNIHRHHLSLTHKLSLSSHTHALAHRISVVPRGTHTHTQTHTHTPEEDISVFFCAFSVFSSCVCVCV